MFLKDPIFYFKNILSRFPNSYLAEDGGQIIIGIDCEYLQGDDLDKLKFALQNTTQICEFAGLFGVLSYEAVYKFERLGDIKPRLYDFPTYFYANARAYLHYDKQSKIYSFYGEGKYFENLENSDFGDTAPKFGGEKFYKIKTDLNAEKKDAERIFKKAKEYIKSGDIFQVVPSQTLQIYSNLDPLEFYEILKRQNPSHYMYFFPTPYGVVAGSSPELVLQIRNNEIFVAPIAGTRPRGKDANEDEALKNELLGDEKEMSEHKMLVDLARNDIGKFAKKGSVKVLNLAHVQFFESVMHIVSDVRGIKIEGKDNFDVLGVVFPAGTLSGSPKIRAMQIINELESHARGIYGGGIGFWHFNGDLQMAILIRSAIFVRDRANPEFSDVFVGAGYGQVYDSVFENEYAEICNKRKSCLKIFEKTCKEMQ